ncbi:MAG: hypothetical protein CMF27_06350 [Kiritimatiellaceae bacterium]|jgi:tetratricopeptide (TPR) repeat protein|nr:hypothetical protein [Kiritimatiellaceae bacterium]
MLGCGSSWIRGGLSVFLWFSLLSVSVGETRGLTVSQLDRLNPKVESTSRLLSVCRELLRNEQHAAAVPFLEEVVFRLEDDSEKKAQQTLAFSIFQLADCSMKLGEYERAAEGFRRFADLFDLDPQRNDARLLAAECFSLVGLWAEAEAEAASVLDDVPLEDEMERSVLRLFAEACFEQKKWVDSIEPLRKLFRFSQSDEDRSRASVMLVTSYARLNQFAELFRFLPYCNQLSRHELALNVALLEAGDYQYHQAAFSEALLLYREVVSLEEIKAYQWNRLNFLEQQIVAFRPGMGRSLAAHQEARLEIEKKVAAQRVRIDQVEQFINYDVELLLRMGQASHQLKRHWLTYTLYQALMERYPASEVADQAHYASFTVLLDEAEWLLAKQEGYAYLHERSEGLFWDDAALNLLQLHMQEEQWDAALTLGLQVREERLDYPYADQLGYVLGYIYFKQFNFVSALHHFSEVLDRYPTSSLREMVSFWKGLTHLYLTQFDEAMVSFRSFLSEPDFVNAVLREEALYRLGMSQYGATQYEASEQTFLDFVEQYPDGRLASEAFAMLGDLRAAEGSLEEGIVWYGRALNSAEGLDQYNYPFFQRARVWKLQDAHEIIVENMQAYMEDWKEQADFARAVSMSMDALEAMNDYPKALSCLLDRLEEFGGDPELAGVDRLQERLIADYKKASLLAYQDVILEWVSERLEQIETESEVLALRYHTVMAALQNVEAREPHLAVLLQERAVKLAGPLGLSRIAEYALEKERYELVLLAEQQILNRDDRSLSGLEVRVAALDARMGLQDYEDINSLSAEILEQYGYGVQLTGVARVRAGDALRFQGRYEEAISLYEEVLATREWRGGLTPEVLFWMGSCRMALGQWAEAFAYYQRIYVLYGGYPAWVAKAYIESMNCLEALGGREEELMQTCREMILIPALAFFPETDIARAWLERLSGEIRP